MKLWIVTRIGQTPWNAYTGFVIRAASEEEALAIARKEAEGTEWKPGTEWHIEQVTEEGNSGIIITDFMSG